MSWVWEHDAGNSAAAAADFVISQELSSTLWIKHVLDFKLKKKIHTNFYFSLLEKYTYLSLKYMSSYIIC